MAYSLRRYDDPPRTNVMSKILPINIDNLLHHRGVESERVEFKASWDSERTGPQVLKTICAFANDYHALNGGYIVIGVEEQDGCAVLPPKGLDPEKIDAAQRWIRGQCNRLDPSYAPVFSPERIDDRNILIVWVPASDMRPHRAPDKRSGGQMKYWVRLGSETVDAEQRGNLQTELIQMTAKIPWDDRRSFDAEIQDFREAKVREYLRDVNSGLLDESDEIVIYRRMRITRRVNGHEIPRNVGLLFFATDPTRWFPSAKIEVVQFAADRAGNIQEERTFGGSLTDQLRDCLTYLKNLSTTHLQKERDRSRIRGWVDYPLPALRETLVNAVYHRSYQPDQLEPTKVYLYPNRIEIISYPGPVPGIEHKHLTSNASVSYAPARNRRIGEFLKELGLAEGRMTGLSKVFRVMEENGSPAPQFTFDEDRTYFQATLPAHPEYVAISAMRDAAHLRALGEDEGAYRRIESAWQTNRASAILAVEMIRWYAERDDLQHSEEVLTVFREQGPESAMPHVINMLIEVLVEAGENDKARHFFDKYPQETFGQDAIDAAILARRIRDSPLAHRYFERAGETVNTDPRALLEFAQTKIALAQDVYYRRESLWRDTNLRFLREARSLLERVIQLDASRARHAWAWRELARVLVWLNAPSRDIEDAYATAITLLPNEERFLQEFEKWKNE